MRPCLRGRRGRSDGEGSPRPERAGGGCVPLPKAASPAAGVGLEAGPLSPGSTRSWPRRACRLRRGPACAGARAQPNKTDRNDARGIAEMIRVGLYGLCTSRGWCARAPLLLTARKLLHAKLRDLETGLQGAVENFGLRVGRSARAASARGSASWSRGVRACPRSCAAARGACGAGDPYVLHKRLLDLVRDDPLCRRLMTAPGVGPLMALTFKATVDVPSASGTRAGRRPFRADAKAVPVRRDRCAGRDQQLRRRDGAHRALRGGQPLLVRTVPSGRPSSAGALSVAKRRGMKRARWPWPASSP